MSEGRLPYAEGARRYERLLEQVFGVSSGQDGKVAESVRSDRPAYEGAELEVQARWFAGEFGRRFSTPEGESVEIVQFGHWNRSAGPDFTEAVVRIGDRRLCGAIEIDLDPRDWENHGHGVNPAYDEVVLHLFARSPQTVTFFTRNSSHREVVQAELDMSRFDPTRSVMGTVPEARLGRCAAPLEHMAPERVATLVDAAAQFRLQRKARRFQTIASVHGREQALWIGVAEAFGYRHNQLPMAVLAQRLPVAKLRRRAAGDAEALLFGAAGFIDGELFDDTSMPEDTRAYLRGIWDRWWKLRPDFELGRERALQWTLSGARPMNHPQRRLAALAELVSRWQDLLQCLPEEGQDEGGAGWVREVLQFFASLQHPYWSSHYTLRSKRAAKSMALVGGDRAHDIVGNVLVPLLHHEDGSALWQAFTALPASLDNQSLRRARLRLFGGNEELARIHKKRFFHQQALLQIYRDFCLEDHSDCADCPFPEQLAQWGD